MKCKICGYKTRELPKMAEHYRSAHPQSMKSNKTKTYAQKAVKLAKERIGETGFINFCPNCGKRIEVKTN